jgi:hypothetical protein
MTMDTPMPANSQVALAHGWQTAVRRGEKLYFKVASPSTDRFGGADLQPGRKEAWAEA